jgi:NADH-quinone oxidoreductase subunit L
MSPLLPLALIVLLAPFVAFLLNAFVARRAWALAGAFTILGVGAAFVASLLVMGQVLGGARLDVPFPWLTIGPNQSRVIELGLRVDPITAAMLIAVTGVSLLVQIYSWGYLHETEFDAQGHPHVHRDPGFSRYYCWMALFTFSMLGLVLANGFLTLFIFWELVGLCSYLLIGFWYDRGRTEARPLVAEGYAGQYADERLSPPEAAKKAFLTTRLGDLGLLIGMLLIWSQTGTFTFSQVEAQVPGLPTEVVTAAALLVFCGAVGKSAQFPLHVWLPDAMEGPTPVSALIHAATMVAAGVYLVGRTYFLFEAAPVAMLVVAVIGGFTAFFAATMGMVNNDIKRVMAYSTVSQLGYMFLALGVGGLGVALFHLFSHAWFKALLFLTAGSVIHGSGTQDMREMGGLSRLMPWTFVATLIAGLSLVGIPPLSGFWSKDLIIAAVEHNHPAFEPGRLLALDLSITGLLVFFALMTVLMTAFYTARLLWLTFGGRWRGDPHLVHHIHEAPAPMLLPMLILVVPTVLIGFWGSPFFPDPGSNFVGLIEAHPFHEDVVLGELLVPLVLALVGIGIAWAMYSAKIVSPTRFVRLTGPLYSWAYNKWGFDALYNWLVGGLVVGFAWVIALFDQGVVDGVVNLLARVTVGLGRIGRGFQTGQVQTYAWVVFGGVVIVAAALVLPALFRGA